MGNGALAPSDHSVGIGKEASPPMDGYIEYGGNNFDTTHAYHPGWLKFVKETTDATVTDMDQGVATSDVVVLENNSTVFVSIDIATPTSHAAVSS